jgi:hypothetical protein
MYSFSLFLCVFVSLTSFIQAKGTKPSNKFECSWKEPTRVDIIIETGSQFLAGTDDRVRLFLRDSQGVVCIAADLNNSGDDHERNSIDEYAVCCPEDSGKANESLSLLLLGHLRARKSPGNDWFIERIKVHSQNFLLLDYRFHAWTGAVMMFGVTKVKISRLNNEKSSYSLIRF